MNKKTEDDITDSLLDNESNEYIETDDSLLPELAEKTAGRSKPSYLADLNGGSSGSLLERISAMKDIQEQLDELSIDSGEPLDDSEIETELNNELDEITEEIEHDYPNVEEEDDADEVFIEKRRKLASEGAKMTNEDKASIPVDSGIDPVEDFKAKLKDMGITKSVKVITDSFFSGNIDDPQWLVYVLAQAGLSARHRELMIMSYYGRPAAELGIDPTGTTGNAYIDRIRNPTGKAPGESSDVSEEADKEIMKLRKETLQAAKEDLALQKMKRESALIAKQMKDLDGTGDIDMSKQPMMRTVKRPIILNGELMRDDKGNILVESVQEPVYPGQSSGSGDLSTVLPIIMQMMGTKKEEPRESSDVSAMKAMVTQLMEMQKESTHRQEVTKLEMLNNQIKTGYEEKMERLEREYKSSLESMKKDHLRDLENLQNKFESTMANRDAINQIAGSYQSKLDEMEKMLNSSNSNMKDMIAREGTTMASKMVEQINGAAETMSGPMIEMMKQTYKLQVDAYKKQHGLTDGAVPDTTDDELAAFTERLNEE